MIQFYVLALAFMLYGAAVLLADEYGDTYSLLLRIRETHLSSQTFTIVVIVLTAVIGILKLISPVNPGPVVIGDFLPAVNLMALAVFFAFDIRKQQKKTEGSSVQEDENEELYSDSDALNKMQNFYYKNKKILGYTTLGVVLLHFLFPGAVLL